MRQWCLTSEVSLAPYAAEPDTTWSWRRGFLDRWRLAAARKQLSRTLQIGPVNP
jgi:hypothetical protein